MRRNINGTLWSLVDLKGCNW